VISESGRNIMPTPKPCSRPAQNTSAVPVSRLKLAIIQVEIPWATKPSARIRRESMYATRRPQRISAIMLPMPRGASSRPIISTG
jgi:hypothetical protein